MRPTVMTSKLLALMALAASICLARPAQAQGTPEGNAPGSPNTGAVAAPGGQGFELAPAWETPSPFWFATAPVYEVPSWGYPSVYGPVWSFPLVYSPPYPGPLSPVDFAIASPASVYGNLPLLGINTSLHTAGGGPAPYVHTRAAINLVPGE